MDYTTDTHSLVWYLQGSKELSPKALKAFEQTKKKGIIIIPSVVLAELMFIADKGKVTLSFEKTISKIERYINFKVASLDIDIIKVANNIKSNLEMHDKLIVATALFYSNPLITKDSRIKKSKEVDVIW